MQMENIFNELTISRNYFNDTSDDIEDDMAFDLWCYLYVSLDKENANRFRFELAQLIRFYADGKYI